MNRKSSRPLRRAPRSPARQLGMAAFFIIGFLAVAGVGAALTMFSARSVDAAAARNTVDALGFTRDALIAYATSRGGPTGAARPGEFPCPDIDNDGREDLSTTAPVGACRAGLGRVPWLTLGIPEPKDSAGETLWYAISPRFRNFASNPTAINSDTPGTLTVAAAGTATPIHSQAVAVVLAPGAPIGTQPRGAMVEPCASAGGAAMAQSLCASNYLEAFGTGNNSAANGPFVSVPAKTVATFNDTLAYIRTADFIPAVEQRVGGELQALVEQYRNVANVYPWAAKWNSDLGAVDLSGLSAVGVSRGRFPVTALPYGWNTVVGAAVTPRLPDWVEANGWQHVIYYSVGKGQLDPASPCLTCTLSPTLSFTANAATSQVSAVLMLPGTPGPGQTRPSTSLANYFEDAQNTDSLCGTTIIAGTCEADAYREPAAAAMTPPKLDRDRIFPMTSSTVTCAQAAHTLAGIGRTTTCGGPGNSVIPACLIARSQLLTCPKACYSAAQTMTKPPCYNVSNNANPPNQCQSALSQLDVCT